LIRARAASPLGQIARAISTVPQTGDPQLDLVALLKAERLDNVGGQANGGAITPLSTRIGVVPLRSTGLHIYRASALVKRCSHFVLDKLVITVYTYSDRRE